MGFYELFLPYVHLILLRHVSAYIGCEVLVFLAKLCISYQFVFVAATTCGFHGLIFVAEQWCIGYELESFIAEHARYFLFSLKIYIDCHLLVHWLQSYFYCGALVPC